MRSMEEREVEEDMGETDSGGMCEGWSEHRKCTLPIKLDCWC